jgi:hypothetical protein
VTNIPNSEQIEIWKYELALAMSSEQWQEALKFCGKLRFSLRQFELSDSKVMKAHHQAKEAWAKQLIQEKLAHREHLQQRNLTMRQIRFGKWEEALHMIETLYQDGANRKEIIDLLHELEVRTQTFFSPHRRLKNPRRAEISKQFDELVIRITGGSLENWNKRHFKIIDQKNEHG